MQARTALIFKDDATLAGAAYLNEIVSAPQAHTRENNCRVIGSGGSGVGAKIPVLPSPGSKPNPAARWGKAAQLIGRTVTKSHSCFLFASLWMALGKSPPP